MRFNEGDICLRGFWLDNDGLEFRLEFRRIELLLQIVLRNAASLLRTCARFFSSSFGSSRSSRMLNEG